MAVTKHPSTQERFKMLSARFLKLRKEHEVAVNRLWVGTLATSFTDEELILIKDYLCPSDQALLERLRDPQKAR